MRKHFYSHIATTESVVIKLHGLEMSDEQRLHLIALMDSSLHHVILDAILAELTPADKKIFLKELASDDHEAIWKFLRSKITGIEDKIQKAAEDLKDELHGDINEVSK